MVYSRSYDTFSMRAKNLLRTKGVGIKIIDVDKVENGKVVEKLLLIKLNKRPFPNIFINGNYIGGYSDLQSLNSSG